jgi:catechol 2,3-dioxygenase-like lactoylglutathione lyase family enzyme
MKAIEIISIPVSDQETGKKFYTEKLGLKLFLKPKLRRKNGYSLRYRMTIHRYRWYQDIRMRSPEALKEISFPPMILKMT